MIQDRKRKFFNKSYLMPKDGQLKSDKEVEEIRKNIELLNRCRDYYDSMYEFRKNRRRNVDYTFGRQLNDLIQDPDGCGMISEKEYIMKQGNIPLVSNVIRKIIKSVVGVYRQNKTEPVIVSRDRDEQKLGEMMTVTMQYEYQTNQIHEINARSFEEFNISGLIGWRIGYGWNEEKHIKDLYIDQIDNNRIFFDRNTSGLYLENIELIGLIHDMSILEVDALCDTFEQSDRVREIYKNKSYYTSDLTPMFDGYDKEDMDFFVPKDSNKCRVIEVWTKESERCIRIFDPLKGSWQILDEDKMQEVIDENNRRKQEIVSLGGNEEDALLIEAEKFIYTFWVGRWLTPYGHVIKQMESPYWHNSHPFVIGAYPLIDGEIRSIVDDAIPTQRAINRLIQRIEFVRMASAKGVLIIPEQLLEGKDLNEIASQWAKANGVIALKWKEGIPMPEQKSTNVNLVGDMDMLKMQMSILDDITGIHGALRGEKPTSGTPSSLYAQEAQNAATNITDAQEWFNGLVKRRDTKAMKVVQQYYNEKKYMDISGKDYSEEAKWYDPDKVRNTDFDLSLAESTSSIAARTVNENILMELLKMGAIDANIYLESSSMPSSDKILERIKSRQHELQNQQAQMQGQVNPLIQQAMQ